MKLRRLAVGLIAAASTVYAAHNITISPTSTSIGYSGTWNTFTNCGGTEYTYGVTGYFTFSFVGTAVYVVGTDSQQGGTISFNLDGALSQYDRYDASAYACSQMLFAKDGLANSSHTLIATFTGNSPGNSTANAFLEFQYIMYTQPDPTDSISSSASPTSTSAPTSSAPSTSTSESTTSTALAGSSQASSGGGSKSHAGAIAGGVVGGIIGLVIIGFLIRYFTKKPKGEVSTNTNRSYVEPP